MIVEWSEDAIQDRNDIYDRILSETSKAADAHDDRIWASICSLADFPGRGRRGKWKTSRELVIPGTQYIAIYSIELETIIIHRILHGRRRSPVEQSL